MLTESSYMKHSDNKILNNNGNLITTNQELADCNQKLLREIEERKKLELKLLKSRHQYQLLTENMKDVVWVIDAETLHYTYVSPSVTKLCGYTPDEVLSMPLCRSLSAQSFNHLSCLIIIRLETFQSAKDQQKTFYTDELELTCKDGSTVWTEVVTNYFTNLVTGRIEIHGVTRDISKRKTSEEAKRNAESKLINSYKRLQELTAHVHTAIEDEKKSIAREIHDELGMILTSLKFDLSWIKRNYSLDDHHLSNRIKAMETSIHKSVQAVNRIVSSLRPLILDDLDFAAAIEWHIKEFEKRTGITCSLDMNLNQASISQDITTCFYRIFQESLTNIIRHANATKVQISLFTKFGYNVMQITDNGKGILEEEKTYLSSYGIRGMRERARLIGGEMIISGNPGKGTSIEVFIPISEGNVND